MSRTDVVSRLAAALLFAAPVAGLSQGGPLSKRLEIDFFRDIPSRNLQGLATRSDGRLVAGPVLTDLAGDAPADLLWSLEPAPGGGWLVGTGPEGKIFSVAIDAANGSYSARPYATLADNHVVALRALPDGSVLAGTSPGGSLVLLRNGSIAARADLPADSILDLLPLDERSVLVATGNPGKIYRVDLAKFSSGGATAGRIADDASLANRGLTLFGEIRDRNVRRIVRMPDGRVAAGSSPRGNIYLFPADGGAPALLQENRDAEVTDLLPQENGDLYAALVFSGALGETRINRPRPAGGPAGEPAAEAPLSAERFSGRGAVVWLPAGGFPETIVSRNNTAFYRIARRGDTLLIAGGESGDLLGYDLNARSGLTFAGSAGAQLNAIAPVGGSASRYILLRNNAPGLALLDFAATGQRRADTRRLDLSLPSTLGALRFNRLRELQAENIGVNARTNLGSDEAEGWSPWNSLKPLEGGFQGDNLRGRYVQLRIELPPAAGAGLEIDRASLFHLPQNRRPTLTDFRVVSPNFALVPAGDSPPPIVSSLSQLINRSPGTDPAERRRSAFMSSQVVPQPGTQLMLWTVTDPDGDGLTYTFSIRREDQEQWTDIAVGSADPYVQFDTAHLPEGTYFTRLVAREEAPRPATDRLTTTFQTDDLVIDRTRPEILEATAERRGDSVRIALRGRDSRSLIEGAEFAFNSGLRESLQQPDDGIRDGREEGFTLEIPMRRIAGATSVEVLLSDERGNIASRRIALP